MNKRMLDYKMSIDEAIEALEIGAQRAFSHDMAIPPDTYLPMRDFIRFLYLIVLNGPLQLLEKQELSENGGLVITSEKKGNETIENWWSIVAPFWVAIETPTNYYMTMFTMTQFLKKIGVRGGSWLSLGSGPGLYETYLAKLLPGVHITSLDAAPGMSDFHRALSDRYAKNQTIITQDIADLSQFAAASQEFILANNSLQWLERSELEKAIHEMYRVLKKKGDLFVFVHMHTMQISVTEDRDSPAFSKNLGTDGDRVFQLLKGAGFVGMTRRMILGDRTGQMGRSTARLFIHLRKQ